MRLLSLWFAIAFLLLNISSASAGGQGVDRRQEDLNPKDTTEAAKPTSDADAPRTQQAISTSTASATEATVTSSGTAKDDSTTRTVGSDATTTEPVQPSSTSKDANSKADPDSLPLEPRISPAFAITGVVLLISGVIYGLIGIKKRWAQVFLSTAFLAGLSVTVLIVYVMNPPVPDARQGGYFVACFLTGVVFGGVSLVFQEITEGLGCLLGGFCLSMWLLALRPGGLLPEKNAKVAFIASFTAASYATSFSHYTRPYGLIGSTSFGGATATILGIDCFSRAGLKEFWLYIWELNPDVFPLNTTTYPITRGIRVELAGIVVACLIGIVSQIKLWKVVSERRKAKLAAKADEEQQRDKEEEEAGRNLEEANSREMAVWEATYDPAPDKQRADSGIGRDDSARGKEDADRSSTVSRTEEIPAETQEDESGKKPAASPGERSSICEFPKNKGSGSENQGGGVLSSDDETSEVYAASQDIQSSTAQNRTSNISSTVASVDVNTVPQTSGGSRPMPVPEDAEGIPCERFPENVSPTPSVTPLPFRIPFSTTGKVEADELSVAASAGSDIDMNEFSRRFSRLSNFTRLSGLFGGSSSPEPGDRSTTPADKSRPVSGAVIVDSAESQGDESMPEEVGYELKTTPNSVGDQYEIPTDPQDFTTAVSQGLEKAGSQEEDDKTHRSSINIRLSGVSDLKETSSSALPSPMLTVPLTEPEKKAQDSTNSCGKTSDEAATPSNGLKRPVSAERSTTSRAGSLTAGAVEMLPSQTSNLTMSYRTNEWAKHLSRAEIPTAEPIQQPTLHGEADDTSLQEEPVIPVNVIQLQQTALDAQPPPAVDHHGAATTTSDDLNPTRPALTVPAISSEENATPESQIQSSWSAKHLRPSSQHVQSRGFSTPNSLNTVLDGSPGHNGYRNSSAPFPASSIQGSVIQESSEWESSGNMEGSPTPAPPLMAIRDSIIRNRMSSSFLNRNSSAPSLSKYQQAYTDASGGTNGMLRTQSFGTPDDDIPLAQRREMIRQQSFNRGEQQFSSPNSITSHDYARSGALSSLSPPSRQAPNPEILREANLAAWRESVREEIAMEHAPQTTVEARRADMLMEKRQSIRGKQQESMMAQYRDQALTEAMQRGDMQHLHREAMRKMQAQANQRT